MKLFEIPFLKNEKLSLDSPIIQSIISHGMKIIIGLGIWIVGFWIIKKINKLISTKMGQAKFDPSLQGFLGSLLSFMMKGVVVMMAVSAMGLELTSLLAILGGAAIGVGMALQGSLSNFAGGILILMFKPFRVGDLIESDDKMGFVQAIDLLNSTIITPGHKKIYIPNANVISKSITNLSTSDYVRIRSRVGIRYDQKIAPVKDMILEEISNNVAFLLYPPPRVDIEEFGENSVHLVVSVFVNPNNYWTSNYELNDLIKQVFDKNNIEIPFPQRVVYQKNIPA
ncbi:MAG: hypothetical protein C4K58_08490 [Flavobacteriaceae bacterium]|nr:MAG: hypothetical protein C4K58_08490 [Flavobacteriaceae bacterium]